MIPSRGKHREFAQVSTQQSHRSSATHAERRSRTAPFHSSPPPPPPLTFPSLRNLSLPFRLSYLSAPRSLHFLSVFSASSRWNVTTFAKAFDLDAGGWRRGRRIRIKRTDCRKLVENPDEIREPPRCRAASFPLAHPSVVGAFSTRDAPLSLSFFPSRSRAACLAPPAARPSSFTGFSQFYYRALPSRLTM